MTDPIVRVFREAAKHGTYTIGETRLKTMISKWLNEDGTAAFAKARRAGTIVPSPGTDNLGEKLYKLA